MLLINYLEILTEDLTSISKANLDLIFSNTPEALQSFKDFIRSKLETHNINKVVNGDSKGVINNSILKENILDLLKKLKQKYDTMSLDKDDEKIIALLQPFIKNWLTIHSEFKTKKRIDLKK